VAQIDDVVGISGPPQAERNPWGIVGLTHPAPRHSRRSPEMLRARWRAAGAWGSRIRGCHCHGGSLRQQGGLCEIWNGRSELCAAGDHGWPGLASLVLTTEQRDGRL